MSRRPTIRPPAPRPGKCHALTLVEVAVSMFVMSMMLLAALGAVGGARRGLQLTAERQQGVLLAHQLMTEILQQPYEDVNLGEGSFGLGADEVGDGSRALWEDVDDYDGWSASPPQDKAGNNLAGFDDWSREVDVAWYDLSNTRDYDTRVKRVTVTVRCRGRQVAQLVALRTGSGMPLVLGNQAVELFPLSAGGVAVDLSGEGPEDDAIPPGLANMPDSIREWLEAMGVLPT